jgi:hypothetical protein
MNAAHDKTCSTNGVLSFRTDLTTYSQLSEAVAHWHRAVIWSTWMRRCGRSSAVVLPKDEGSVCDYARLVLEVLWDCIAITITITIRTRSGGGQTHKHSNTKTGSSGTLYHSAEDRWVGGIMV